MALLCTSVSTAAWFDGDRPVERGELVADALGLPTRPERGLSSQTREETKRHVDAIRKLLNEEE